MVHEGANPRFKKTDTIARKKYARNILRFLGMRFNMCALFFDAECKDVKFAPI
jgi:hypothetical protein